MRGLHEQKAAPAGVVFVCVFQHSSLLCVSVYVTVGGWVNRRKLLCILK